MGSPLGAVDNVHAAIKDANNIYNQWEAVRRLWFLWSINLYLIEYIMQSLIQSNIYQLSLIT